MEAKGPEIRLGVEAVAEMAEMGWRATMRMTRRRVGRPTGQEQPTSETKTREQFTRAEVSPNSRPTGQKPTRMRLLMPRPANPRHFESRGR